MALALKKNGFSTIVLAAVVFVGTPHALADKTPKKERVRGPDIVLVESEKRTVYEYRQNGRLTMIKVVPKKGKPYYLVPEDPTKHFGDLERAERLVPQWTVKEF